MSFFSDLPSDPAELAKFLERSRQLEIERTEHYAAIGKVASQWAFFESLVDGRTIDLGNLPLMEATCLTANITSLNKLDAYFAMAKWLGSNKKGEFEKFKQSARGLAEQRNRVVHDPWILVSPRDRAIRVEATARGTLRTGAVFTTTEEVLKLAANIEELAMRFAVLSNEVTAEIKSLG